MPALLLLVLVLKLNPSNKGPLPLSLSLKSKLDSCEFTALEIPLSYKSWLRQFGVDTAVWENIPPPPAPMLLLLL